MESTRAKRCRSDRERGETFTIVLTIGHSTRRLDECIALLKANAVTVVVDFGRLHAPGTILV